MELSLSDVNEADRGILAPCGIICAGCDWHTYESGEAAEKIIRIWEEHNLADVAFLKGLSSEEVLNTIDALKKYVGSGSCPGCFLKQGGFICSIGKCVKAKGYWTCAECEEYMPGTTHPCSHTEDDSNPMIPSRHESSAIVCKRYNSNPVENLKKCRKIGYPAFIEEIKEKVEKGWRTWQVISNEMVVSTQA